MKPILVAQNCAGETAGAIVDYLRDHRYPFMLIHTYAGQELPDPADVDSIICMGCPESVTRYQEFPYLRDLYSFVATSVRRNTPYLGICFGGQLLARVLGAEVKANLVKEIGTYKVRLTEAGKNDALFAGFDDIFEVFQWHGDTFRVPFGAELLVEGDDCKNQAFRKGNLVGLQFHLETPADEVAGWCDLYPHELGEVQKTKDEIVSGYRPLATKTHASLERLLNNYLGLIRERT